MGGLAPRKRQKTLWQTPMKGCAPRKKINGGGGGGG
eukprot:SAG11_NODE_1187_length_5588_cov_6.285662_7_plen_35_part_01